MRGKPIIPGRCAHMPRNIPAYAGKTVSTGALVAVTQEHPRVCGENIRAATGKLIDEGTSPRMRGKPVVRIVDGFK